MTTLPNFDAATFKSGDAIDNPYFPLIPGTIYTYEGEQEDEETGEEIEENIRLAVTFKTEKVAGVDATVIRETAWTNDFLQEDTDDWFAQDTDGNVWYLGESTTAFEYDDAGNFIGTNNEGAWEAGVNGAQPGYIMKANPQPGDAYYQEFAPKDEALDQARVIKRDRTLSTEVGRVKNVLQTLEFSELSPGAFDYKYYAPDVGLVLVEELDETLQPDFVLELESITSATPQAFISGHGTRDNDVLDGDNRANTLKGRQGNDFLQGFGGKDCLLGDDGNDFLVGGHGVDKLKGGKGQDILVGGKGADVVEGGQGRDQFVFRTLADRGDRIKDFSQQDVIIVAEIVDSPSYGSANPVEDYLQIQQLGSRTVIRIDPDGDAGLGSFKLLATLQNTNAGLLSADNFVV
jgi:Ca2+-binding RTX toxin-like protein